MSDNAIQFADGDKTLALIQQQAARIAALEAQLAEARERERGLTRIIMSIRIPLELDGRFSASIQAIDAELAALAAAEQEGE